MSWFDDITVKCVTLDMPENGLTQQLLDETDVLIWWAHMAHDQVSDEVAQREQQRVWCVSPGHPIAAGLGESFVIPKDETYGEYFEIPTPDELVFISWYSGGNVFRSGCCWKRGAGKIFYFQGGHETYPIYYQPEIKRLLQNAVRWAAPAYSPIIFNEARHEKIPPVEQ